MRVAILPSGALLADTTPGDDEASDGLSAAARARVARAFARGAGHALLDLGRDRGRRAARPGPRVPARPRPRVRDPALRPARPRGAARAGRGRLPPDERARLAGAVPPMDGGEYVDADWVAARWADLHRAFADEIRAHRGSVGDWLRARHPSWHVVGRVCFHLAENRGDDGAPVRLPRHLRRAAPAAGGKVQHAPLARALEESSARGDRQALLLAAGAGAAGRGAERAGWPSWSTRARSTSRWPGRRPRRTASCSDVPALEAAGRGRARARLVARAPPAAARGDGDASATKRPRARRHGRAARLLGRASRSTASRSRRPRCAQLLAPPDGLVLLRGQWVELDRERLREVLEHWKRVEREAERRRPVVPRGHAAARRRAPDRRRRRGAATATRRLVARRGRRRGSARRSPGCAARTGSPRPIRAPTLRGTLRPYQQDGVAWLRLRLALRPRRLPGRRHGPRQDDPGAGAAAPRSKRQRRGGEPPHLLVVPASLLAQLAGRVERFAPSLTTLRRPPVGDAARASSPSCAGADARRRRRGASPPTARCARVEALRERASGRWSCSTRRRRSRTPARGRRARSRRCRRARASR